MKKELVELLNHLKDVSDEKHNQGIGLHDTSESLSEWNYGYSEGLGYAIEKIEVLMKELEQALQEIQAITKGLTEFNATYEKIHNIANKALTGGNTHD